MNKIKSTSFLDGIRGFAAFYVLMHHARWLLTESYSYRQQLNFGNSLLNKVSSNALSFFRYGHEMVILFFVLSGFVIHLSVLKTFGQKKFSKKFWLNYFIKRFNRIYPPFVFALVFTFFVDCLGMYYFNFPFYSHGSKYSTLILDSKNFTSIVFLGNFFNLQGLVSNIPFFGSDGALWSLSYEWWFYLLYPFFFWIHRKSKLFAFLLMLSLYILTQYFISNLYCPILFPIFQKMIIWWLGVLLAEVYVGNITFKFRYLSFLLFLIPISVLFFYHELFSDLLWGIGFIGLLSYLIGLSETSFILKSINKLKFIGDGSYTLYLIHEPILYFFHAYLVNKFNGSLPMSYSYMFLIPIFIFGFTYLLSNKLEKLRPFQNF